MNEKELIETLIDMRCQKLVDQANFETLLEAVTKAVPTVEWIPTLDWWLKRRRERLQKILLDAEDLNPEVAAAALGRLGDPFGLETPP